MATSPEHLRAAERIALRARHAPGLDAAELVRGWSRLARASLAAQTALEFEDSSRTVERIASSSLALEAANARREWPGPGQVDSYFVQAASAIRAAVNVLPNTSMDDRAAAQHALSSTLWVASNLVGERAHDHRIDLLIDRVPDSEHEQRAAIDVHRRLAAIEQLAMEAALRIGPVTHPGAANISGALASWDLAAHRALMTDRSTAVLHTVAHQELAIAQKFNSVIETATGMRLIDEVDAARLKPTLAAASAAWSDVTSLSAELSFGSTVPSLDLIDTSDALRREFGRVAGPVTQDEARELLAQVAGHLATSLSITAATRDLIEDRQLRAPAQGVNRVMRSWASPHSLTKPAVEPMDVYLARSIELPKPLRELLRDHVDRAYLASSESISRVSATDPGLGFSFSENRSPRMGRESSRPAPEIR